MPIKFIQHFCKRNELFNKIPIKKDSDLIIDGDALLYYIYIQSQNFTYGGDSEKLYNTAVKFFTMLKQQNVDIFVYVPLETGDIDEKRNDLRIQVFNDLMKQIKEDPQANLQKTTRGFRFNPNAKQILIQAMRDNEIDYQCVEGDVQPYCVQDAIERDVPVLGYDTVYFGHNITFYYIDSIYLDHDKYYKHQHDGDIPEIQCNGASGKSISNKLQISIEQLQLLLRCLPNDYVSGLQYFRDDLEARIEPGSRKDGKDGMIYQLAAFIKEYWCESDDDMIRIITNREISAYETVLSKRRDKEKQLQKEIDQAKADLQQLEKQLDPENQLQKQRVEDAQKKVKKLQDEKDQLELLQEPNKDEIKKQLEESRIIFQSKEFTQNPMNKHKFSPKWLAKFFREGRLPGFLYNAYVNKMVIFQPCMEDPESNSIQYSLELRRILYGFLELSEVTEYTKIGDQFESHIVKPIKPKLTLDQIITQKLKQDKRAEIVIAALVGEQLAKKILEMSDQKDQHHSQFMTAILIYLARNFAKIAPIDLASLTTCAFLKQNQVRVSRAVQQNQLPRNFTCLHAISITQNIIEAACALNNLLGVPLTLKYDKLLQATDVLYQHLQEGRNQTVIGQYHDRFGTEGFVEELAERLQKDKQTKKLQKCDMQLFEDLDSLPYLNLLFEQEQFKNVFADYKNTLSDEEEDIEETTIKQKQSESIIAPSKNKFASLMSQE